jgi:hypothetical protein
MSAYFTGSAWSQTYAKKTMPVLVNFAERHGSVTYKRLAGLLGNEKNAHPLMSALGRLGDALNSLSAKESKKFAEIPPIQLLVCNQETGRPGNLALEFLGFKRTQTAKMSKQQLDSLVLAAHQRIFSFERWHDVLKALGLKPLELSLPATASVLPKIQEIDRRSTGEGEEHRRLKLFLARNPKRIGIQWNGIGDMEHLLLSGDRLDISFKNHGTWIAVEVKGKQSPEADLIKGIFQCVKYKAVLTAQLRYEVLGGGEYTGHGIPRVLLACGAVLPVGLRKLAESLDVEVKSGISVPDDFVS